MKKTGLLLIVAAVLASACETTLDVELPDHPPQMTVNGFFRSGEVWDIHLSEARSVADGEAAIRNITNATVEILQEDEDPIRLRYAGSGFYRSLSFRPSPSRTYTVRASAPGYTPIEATDTVPDPVPVTFAYEITRLDTIFDAVSADVEVTIQLDDPPDQDEYYRLFVLYRVFEKRTGEFAFFTYQFKVDDEAILAENGDPFEFDSGEANTLINAVFSDALFDGEHREITLNIENLQVVNTHRDLIGQLLFEPGGTLQVYFYNISKTYYDYSTTFDLHDEVEDNPFAEPVQVHTNVENGFGIFAGFNRYLLEIDFRDDEGR